MFFGPRLMAAPSALQWNPSAKNASVTLSNGDLTASLLSSTVSYAGVRSVQALQTGTFSVTMNVSAEASIGIANASASLTGFIGTDSNGIGLYQDGRVFRGGSSIATITGFTSGQSVTVDVDTAGQQVRFKVGAGAYSAWYAWPAAGTYYAAAAFYTSNLGNVLITDP